jgi:YVTN family beta-propeller protein
MKKPLFTLFVVVVATVALITNSTGQNKPGIAGLKTIRDVPMPGAADRFDYQSINPFEGHLYISHMNSSAVVVFDLNKQIVIGNINDISRPTGILAVPELGKIYVSASRANEVVVINERTLKVLRRVSTGSFPDGIAYDPNTKKIFVSDEHGKQVTVIDAQTDKFIVNIDMGGEVGNTHYDAVSKKIFSAVQTKNQLVCIDPVSNKIINRFDLKGCEGPHGFYIDPATHYALITGEKKGQFAVFDLTLKKIIYTDKVGDDPDVLAFDTDLRKLYVSGESGVISIFSVEKNKIKKISEGFVAKNAHTISVDQKTHLVYFPLEDIGGKPVLRIMEIQK